VIANAGENDVVLKLRAGGIIEGKVIDASTGESVRAEVCYPLKGAQAEAMGLSISDTRDDGTFKLQSLVPGAYDLIARVSDGRIAQLRGLVVGAGARLTGVVLSVERAARLRVGYEGAHPKAWFTVLLDGTAVAMEWVENKGRSRVQIVPKGKLTIELRFDPEGTKSTRDVDVAAGEEKEIVFHDDG
jgi:hypothetical protein